MARLLHYLRFKELNTALTSNVTTLDEDSHPQSDIHCKFSTYFFLNLYCTLNFKHMNERGEKTFLLPVKKEF